MVPRSSPQPLCNNLILRKDGGFSPERPDRSAPPWVIGPEFSPYLGKKDANDCINGKKCVNLPVVLAQFLAKFEDLLTPRKPG